MQEILCIAKASSPTEDTECFLIETAYQQTMG